jgi:hypothetical protein
VCVLEDINCDGAGVNCVVQCMYCSYAVTVVVRGVLHVQLRDPLAAAKNRPRPDRAVPRIAFKAHATGDHTGQIDCWE